MIFLLLLPHDKWSYNKLFVSYIRLSSYEYVSTIAQTCYFELRHLTCICRFLTSTATATLVFVLFCQELTAVTHFCLVLLMM